MNTYAKLVDEEKHIIFRIIDFFFIAHGQEAAQEEAPFPWS